MPERSDRENYARALSGFANSVGGLIVWGVVENKSKKQFEKRSFSRAAEFRQELDHILPSAVSRPIDDVENLVIASSEPEKAFVVTYVPESDSTPHRAEIGDRYYYQRVGSSFVAIEHNALEDMFGRRPRPKLGVSLESTKHAASSDSNKHTYILRVTISNTGRAMARFYRVVLTMAGEAVAGYDPPRYGAQQFIHASASTDPLFPGESSEIQFQRLDDTKKRGVICYVVTKDIAKQYDDFEARVDIYTDGAAPSTSDRPFEALHNF